MADPDRSAQGSEISSDRSLLRKYCAGQEDAATALYLRYAKRLQALVRAQSSPALAARFDAEDVVQSVFRTFFRRASEGEYDIPPGEELWGLLLVIALNKIRKLGAHHRAQKRDVGVTSDSSARDSGVERIAAEDETAYQTLRLVLEELMAELSPSQRGMVELRIQGHDVQTIARQTMRSKRTVERVLQGFREKLSEVMAADGSF
jgi:RNA polymerase sigma-70 factor (ECF subfamily)